MINRTINGNVHHLSSSPSYNRTTVHTHYLETIFSILHIKTPISVVVKKSDSCAQTSSSVDHRIQYVLQTPLLPSPQLTASDKHILFCTALYRGSHALTEREAHVTLSLLTAIQSVWFFCVSFIIRTTRNSLNLSASICQSSRKRKQVSVKGSITATPRYDFADRWHYFGLTMTSSGRPLTVWSMYLFLNELQSEPLCMAGNVMYSAPVNFTFVLVCLPWCDSVI